MGTSTAATAATNGLSTESGTTAGGEDPGGRLRTSATKFAEPATCRISEVNSEINDKWRVWRGDLSAELAKAPQSGLWSVQMVKGRPSSMWRK